MDSSLDNNMALYIQPNITVFPTASILTGDAIRSMTWLGFSADTTDQQINDMGYIAVTEPAGEQPANTTLVVDKNQSNEYTASWMANADYQQLLDTRAAAGFARVRRNNLLQETDWTQGKDVPDAVSSQWTTYRQALRDITNQSGFPSTINWPQKPA
jgi:hypothetical protein